MVAGSFTEVYVSTIAADRLWKASGDMHILMPMLIPEFIASVEIVEGDGGVGTIKQFNLTEVARFTYVKDRVDVLDNENRVLNYSTIEGGLIGLRMKSETVELKFETGSDGGSVGKATFEYETVDDTPLNEEEQGQMKFPVVVMMKTLEGYLSANPDLYVEVPTSFEG